MPTIELHLLNCFWLMLPILAWNLALGRRITDPRITSDAHSPQWLLNGEGVTRIIVFAFPLLMTLYYQKETLSNTGLGVYIAGTLIYFASWLPLIRDQGSRWSSSTAGLLAPRLTPFLAFVGIAITGHSWAYGVMAAVFTALHTWHGVQNIRNDGGTAKE